MVDLHGTAPKRRTFEPVFPFFYRFTVATRPCLWRNRRANGFGSNFKKRESVGKAIVTGGDCSLNSDFAEPSPEAVLGQ